MLREIRRTRLYEQIMAQLAELIRQGVLRPGDRLPPERDLAAQLGVSRASLREALQAIELRGLVVRRQGAGTFVAQGSPDVLSEALERLAAEQHDLQDIFELRMLIEPPIAALAALRANEHDKERLEAILREQEALVERGESPGRTDEAFHSSLAEATHNSALLQLGAALMEVLAPSRQDRLQTPRRVRLSVESHRRILEAIKAGDAARARRAMEEHILQVDLSIFGLAAESLTSAARALASG